MNDARLDALQMEMLAQLDAMGASTVFPFDEVANLRTLRDMIEHRLPEVVDQIAKDVEGRTLDAIERIARAVAQRGIAQHMRPWYDSRGASF